MRRLLFLLPLIMAPNIISMDLPQVELNVWNKITSVAFSPVEDKIAIAPNCALLEIRDLATGQRQCPPGGLPSSCMGFIKFDPTGAIIFLYYCGKVLITDLTDPDPFSWVMPLCHNSTPPGQYTAYDVHDAIWNPATNELIAVGHDKFISILNITNGQRLADIRGNQMSWHPQGEKIAVTDSDANAPRNHRIKIHDLSGRRLYMIRDDYHSAIKGITWNPSGSQVAVGYHDGAIKVWDLYSSTCLNTLKPHREAILAIAWHPIDDTKIATISSDGNTKVCNIRNGHCLASFPCPTKRYKNSNKVMTWNQTGNKLAFTYDTFVKVVTFSRPQAPAEMLAVAMANHPRLGERSPVQRLPRELLLYIYQFVKDPSSVYPWRPTTRQAGTTANRAWNRAVELLGQLRRSLWPDRLV